ncbi:unnamed protein product [Cylicocyclus nassatus]|uniref:Uncharacterized protein n=1 Tax=Cylicocyclus nassatus TaxID=53992 RepID=A0AA36H2V2_CYLNA|nr:unnamed protein product [Cylicocyclus nassatus]
MTTTVRAYKGLTTKRIDNVLNWLRESSKLLDPVAPDLRQGQAQKIKLAIELCDENISLMESSLTKLTEAFDRIEDTDNEEEEQLDKYLESAQETIIKLHVHKTNLKQVMHEIGQESSDSEIVLGWRKSSPSRQSVGVLIANRLQEIGRIVNDLEEQHVRCLFGHVRTVENPADCGTRGLTSNALQDYLWWQGPNLMHEHDCSNLTPFGNRRSSPGNTTSDAENKSIKDFAA